MYCSFIGKITYTMDETHPDRNCVDNWTPETVYDFEDKYTFDMDRFWSLDDAKEFIAQDLRMVAGGGYGTSHIHNVTIDIRQR